MRSPSSLLGSAVLGLALWSAPASGDIIMPGHHAVHIDVCYEFETRAGHQPVVVVRAVQGYYMYHLLKSGQCVDQGYKFNMVSLYWADSTELAKGIPDSSTDPKKLSWLDSIHCLSDGGRISSNMTQYPDSVLIHEETRTYAIVGNETAVTTINQCAMNGTAPKSGSANAVSATAMCTIQNFNILWTSGFTSTSGPMVPGFSLGSVRGSKVRLTIPEGRATLRVMTLSGRILRQMTILPTGARTGVVDLGMTPPVGSFVELRQGSRSSVISVARP